MAEAPLKQWCEVHVDRPAVDRCGSCGRGVCLACAVPFRGRVLCTACAARELGEPEPEIQPGLPRRIHVAALAAFAVAVSATALPWDRFGVRTAALSAWSWQPDPWSFVASAAVAVAAAVALAGRLLPAAVSSGMEVALGAIAVVSTTWLVVAAPDYVRHTAAPYLLLVAAAAGTLAGVARLRRLQVS